MANINVGGEVIEKDRNIFEDFENLEGLSSSDRLQILKFIIEMPNEQREMEMRNKQREIEMQNKQR